MKVISLNGKTGYELIDSGDMMKLESFGGVIVERPSGSAVWRRRAPELWSSPVARFIRHSSRGGQWEALSPEKIPGKWVFSAGVFQMELQMTDFGHVGVFPEQAENWDWIHHKSSSIGGDARVLNLFAYTGASSLAAACGGASVCHVDASKKSVDWGRMNLGYGGQESLKIRWIVDDVRKFLRREARRGNTYHGIILDPPTFGRGSSGQLWKIEKDLVEVMEEVLAVLEPGSQSFVLLTCNTAGMTPVCLENMVMPIVTARGGSLSSGEMLLHESEKSGLPCRNLPAGSWVRWETR
ncbi:MAG: hypothetical protein CVV64_15320 [Candidatus Wallbacteria bacterium HGW-Wallbacteria-1]|uniref:S-adenosylmethionine-dependent methyltransferase domain-containing protein n=1 Tax=Candidatus Wallbacteria bacterium HGW-Wallbacteria-1 TaxID=2013854 RepID=A0A2N1PLF6_9BACT|nr:MAG: hypothetical protein CVV64_15320 [Candidatus Wallbacteria bacterium HGW-Wallbacteria-1]